MSRMSLPPLSKIAETGNDVRLIIKSLIDPARDYLQHGEPRTKCFQTFRSGDLAPDKFSYFSPKPKGERKPS